jgi:hypothetical protein
MKTPPFCLGKVRAGAEAQSVVLRAQGKTPALFFHWFYSKYFDLIIEICYYFRNSAFNGLINLKINRVSSVMISAVPVIS